MWTDLPAPPADVIGVLADVGAYSRWWPGIARSTPLGDGRGEMALRSTLPFVLRFALSRDVEDRPAGVLRATVEGDMRGTVEWRVVAGSPGTSRAEFTQHVELMHPVRVVDRWIGVALRWNHSRLMRAGERALREHLRHRNASS